MVAAIILNPTHANVGDTVIITGSGFDFTSAITFTFGGSAIVPTDAPITSDGAGAFTAHIVIPASVQGIHAVVATDAGAHSGSANFTTDAHIVLNPTHGEVGVTITITGSGFAGTSLMSWKFGGSAITSADDPVTSSNVGAFTSHIIVPSSTGTKVVEADDASANSAVANFDVSPGIIITNALNSAFAHLNGRDLRAKSVNMIPGREREAIVDITLPSQFEYESGGILIDFSVIQRFKQVYFCKIIQKNFSQYVNFIPGTNNDSKLGKIKIYSANGTELGDEDISLAGKVLTVRIRGI